MDFKAYLVKQGLTEEQADKVINEMSENKFYLAAEEKLDERYSKLKKQKEDLESDLTAANSLVDSLKKSNKSNEDLQQQVDDYKNQIETLNTQRSEDRKNSAIELALKDAKARNAKAVKSLLDMDKIEVTDAGIKGLDDQLESFRESDAYLFDVDQPENNNPSGKQATFEGNANGGGTPPDVNQQMINAFTSDLPSTDK